LCDLVLIEMHCCLFLFHNLSHNSASLHGVPARGRCEHAASYEHEEYMGNMLSMRQARIEDAPLVAWDLETATDRMFSFMLGSRWEQFLIRVVNTPGHAWSIEHARIAEIEGQPLGVILSGPSVVSEPDESFGLPWGWTRMRLTVVGFVFQPFLTLMRQQGVGRAMIVDAVEHARAL